MTPSRNERTIVGPIFKEGVNIMLRHTITALLLLPFMAGISIAQGPHTSMTTMICTTTDGIVRISDRTISVADYTLHFDSVVSDGIIRFADATSGAEAVLDARDDQGLYLLVREGGKEMQVVASRSDISYEQHERATEPATPAYSSILRMIHAPSHDK
jgi:hypothetical protein